MSVQRHISADGDGISGVISHPASIGSKCEVQKMLRVRLRLRRALHGRLIPFAIDIRIEQQTSAVFSQLIFHKIGIVGIRVRQEGIPCGGEAADDIDAIRIGSPDRIHVRCAVRVPADRIHHSLTADRSREGIDIRAEFRISLRHRIIPDILNRLLEVIMREKLCKESLMRLIIIIDKTMLNIQALGVADRRCAVDQRIHAGVVGERQVEVPCRSGGDQTVGVLIEIKAGAAAVEILGELLRDIHSCDRRNIGVLAVVPAECVISRSGIESILEFLIISSDIFDLSLRRVLGRFHDDRLTPVGDKAGMLIIVAVDLLKLQQIASGDVPGIIRDLHILIGALLDRMLLAAERIGAKLFFIDSLRELL